MTPDRSPSPRRPGPLLRALAVALALSAVTAVAEAGTPPADPDIVACYDATRKLVTHTLPRNCQGEIISAEREAEIALERRLRIQSSVQGQTEDPVTGTRRLIGTGSGFYIGKSGELLTNNHVINRCEMITATSDEGAKRAVQLVATDPERDIALLRAGAPAPAIAAFARESGSGNVRLAVVGYPAYGLPTRLSSLAPAETDGAILGTTRDRVEFKGSVRHGNSGSPLLDAAGNVVGLVYATIDTPKVYKATGKKITDIGVAVSESAVTRFLARNGVAPVLADRTEDGLAPEALHQKARGFVVQIGCWR